jgi:hypothetical protein
MRVKTALFCGLSTAQSFQSWLFKFDEGLYRTFSKDLRESRGCDENKRLMLEILDKIETAGGGALLEEFLRQKFPHIIDAPGEVVSNDKHGVFDNYVPGVLTYPRREIIKARGNLQRDVERFLATKINSEYIIIEDTAYVEYLLPGEEDIAAKLPEEKWKIRAYKNSRAENEL